MTAVTWFNKERSWWIIAWMLLPSQLLNDGRTNGLKDMLERRFSLQAWERKEIEKWRKESRSPRFQHLSFVHHDTAGQRPKKDRESMLGNIEKLQLQKRRLRRKRPSKRWKKCNPVRKKKRHTRHKDWMVYNPHEIENF